MTLDSTGKIYVGEEPEDVQRYKGKSSYATQSPLQCGTQLISLQELKKFVHISL